jgi:hypothetical protein
MIYFIIVQEDRCGAMLAHYGHMLALAELYRERSALAHTLSHEE